MYAGTDDGRVWRTPEGAEWIELTDRFDGVPEGTYVSRIEASSHDANRFYVTFDNHRRDDYAPYVYVTEDGGESFRSIASNLPTGAPDFVHVIREDPVNEDLLFVGTDVAAYVSTDRGGSWSRFMNGLPTVPVHDLKIHPREREIIAGTHGRSIFVADISLLQQLDGGELPETVTVFDPKTAIQYGDPPVGGEFIAQSNFQGDAGEYGAEISYYIPEEVAEQLAEAAREERREEAAEAGAEARGPGGRFGAGGGGAPGARARVAVLDADGDTVQVLNGSASAGVNRVRWTFNRRSAPAEPSPADRADSIRNARLYEAVGDSLVEHADVDRAVMDQVLEMARGGNQAAIRRMFGGGGGGGAGGAAGAWRERPAERYPQPGQAGQAGGGRAARAAAAMAAAGGEGGPDPATLREVFQQVSEAMRERGAMQSMMRRFFGGGGGGGLADPGAYTVVIEVGEETLTTTLDVVRKEGFGFWDEPDGEGNDDRDDGGQM